METPLLLTKGNFSIDQTQQLLAPIRPQRVKVDGKGNSHIPHQDVVAHLIRVFGFGNWHTEVVHQELIFEQPHVKNGTEVPGRWDVAYRTTLRLYVFNDKHRHVATYEDCSVGDAENLKRGEAHDLALKSSISLALKRCAKNLGDQFGLSLYNKGQLEALVIGTLVLPDDYREEMERRRAAAGRPSEPEKKDIQEGIPEQHVDGVDETTADPGEMTEEQREMLEHSLGAKEVDEQSADEEQAGMPSQQEVGA